MTRSGPTPSITVVMITRDRCASAVRSIDALTALPEQPPIIVVDNGSADDTVAALTGRPRLRVVAAGRNLGAAGRNVGARLAETPYVAFADDDSWWAPGALATAARELDAHPRLAVLAGRTLVGPGELDDPLNAQLASAPLGSADDLPGPSIFGFLACAAVVRRSAFLDAGGFHDRLGVGGEELLLVLDLLAAGWGLAYLADVVAHHHPAPGPERLGRRVRMLRNELWTAWLRRRLPAAVLLTRSVSRAALREPLARRALLEAITGLPWVLAQRRPLPTAVEDTIRRLDAVTGATGAQ